MSALKFAHKPHLLLNDHAGIKIRLSTLLPHFTFFSTIMSALKFAKKPDLLLNDDVGRVGTLHGVVEAEGVVPVVPFEPRHDWGGRLYKTGE
jgi:hypothetical protein